MKRNVSKQCTVGLRHMYVGAYLHGMWVYGGDQCCRCGTGADAVGIFSICRCVTRVMNDSVCHGRSCRRPSLAATDAIPHRQVACMGGHRPANSRCRASSMPATSVTRLRRDWMTVTSDAHHLCNNFGGRVGSDDHLRNKFLPQSAVLL